MTPERRGDINRLAAIIVDSLALKVPYDIDWLVERLGGTVHRISEPGDCGVVKRGDHFYLRIGESSNGDRRFAVAHQLGHLFLHLGYLVDPELWETSTDYEDSVMRRFDYSREEEEANEFAFALLMPREAFIEAVSRFSVNGECQLLEVSNVLQIPETRVVRRGRSLGVFVS